MEEYRFEHKEPLTQRVVLALRVNTKQFKEQLWLGTEYEVGAALRGLDNPLYLAKTRPLGAFWCEFGKTSVDGWTEVVWALCGALSARRAEREAQEQKAAELLSQLTVGNSTALYAAIQVWEMYLRCCRGRDKHKAETALRDYAQLLILPFGEYSPEMANWKWEKPVVPVWNHREGAKLELWYPHGEIPFECAVVSGSLRSSLIYYRQRILDAGMVMRTCSQCGRVFFAPDSRSNLCSERCRKVSKKAARKNFDSRSREEEYEQAYKREYMFWYNRIDKLKKACAPSEQVERAQAALKQFCKEALLRKQQVKQGKMPAAQFTNWMIGQEIIIQKICGR
ncbi:MAG: hypothetical protein ACLSD3_06560 [Acutalibacteraceae bacterium]